MFFFGGGGVGAASDGWERGRKIKERKGGASIKKIIRIRKGR